MDAMNRNLVINIRNEVRNPYNESDEEFDVEKDVEESSEDSDDSSGKENHYNVNLVSKPKKSNTFKKKVSSQNNRKAPGRLVKNSTSSHQINIK